MPTPHSSLPARACIADAREFALPRGPLSRRRSGFQPKRDDRVKFFPHFPNEPDDPFYTDFDFDDSRHHVFVENIFSKLTSERIDVSSWNAILNFTDTAGGFLGIHS